MASLGGPSLNDLGDIFNQYHAVGHQAAIQVPAASPTPTAPSPQPSGISNFLFHNPIEHAVGNFFNQAYHNPVKTVVGVGKDIYRADRAILRPAVDVLTGQGGKAAHDTAQLSQDVTGGTVNTFAKGLVNTPLAVKRELQNKPITDIQKNTFGTTNSGQIAKKIAASTIGTGSLFVGGGAAAGATRTGLAKTALKLGTAGAAGNASATVNQNPNASLKQIGKSAAVGFTLGAGLPAAGSLLGKAITHARANPTAPPSALDNLVEQVNKAQAETQKGVKTTTPKTPQPVEVGKSVGGAKNLSASTGKPSEFTSFKPENANPITESGPQVVSKSKVSFPSLTTEEQQALGRQLHATHDFKQMETNAQKLVSENPTGARDMFLNRELVRDNPDAHAKLGNALFEDAVKRSSTEAELKANAGPIWRELQAHGTQQGQGLAAMKAGSFVSPQGIVKYAMKVADMKGKPMNPGTLATLKNMAEKIQTMPESTQKSLLINAMKEVADQKTGWQKRIELAKEIISAPRAIMASSDLSFGGRQGAVLGTRFPKEWAQAMKNSVRYAVDQKSFEAGKQRIVNMTDKNGDALYPLMKRAGVDLEGVSGNAEEIFGSPQLAERIPLAGRLVKASDHAFTGAAMDMRSLIFKKIVDGYGGVKGVSGNWTTKDLKDLGKVINTMTGRGHGKEGGWFEKAAPALGSTLFSARLWKSRLDMLNPVFYARLSGPARKIALQSAMSFGATVSAVLGAAAAAGAQVETNPISSDFGKIKIGNTRIDIMGGLQQNIVLAAREIEGKTKSSTTGAVTKMNSKFGGPTRLSTAYGFIQNKETPALGTTSRLLGAGNGGPQVTNPWGEVAKMFIPLGASDIYQGIQTKNPAQAIASVSTEFGTGVQTYSAQSTTNWNKNPGKTLTQFKQQVGQQKYDQANKEFNTAVNNWYAAHLQTKDFKNTPDEQKNAKITAAKNKIKAQIFSNYGFHYHK